MLIDWFTVAAQLLNFLVLVWLLKRFLYRPILDAIDAREARIAAELADADAKRADAAKQRDTFQNKIKEIEAQRATLLKQAREEAKAEREQLLNDARQAADALAEKREATLRNEAHNLGHVIMHRTQQEVFAIARKSLSDLASVSLEAQVTDVFIERLRNMDASTQKSLGESLTSANAPALVRSAFELPPQQQAAIQSAINETFAADIPLRFEANAELVSGIELSSNGQKLAWSIADYLASLETGVESLLTARSAQARP